MLAPAIYSLECPEIMIEMRRMCKWGGVTRGQVAMVRSMRYQVVEEEPPGGDPVPAITHVEPISAMEYRYDGGRQRYMTRSRSPDDLLPDDGDKATELLPDDAS